MRTYWTAPSAFSMLVMTTAALAQSPPAAPSAQAQTPAPATQPATPGTAGAQPHTATPEELIAQGEAVVRRGNTISQGVLSMLQDARKEADIIKITCLDDKLAQVNANLHTAESRLDALKKAVDPDLRMHEYTVLTVLAQKLQVLDQEAHQCVGQAMYETGVTKVVTEINTKMLPFEENTPSTIPVITPGVVPEPSGPTSGTM
jgi:hypothetical protein